ncbi:MAG: D-glycero-beta-D-manno-heptose 1,7-bisphosphate 7-phosphatase [Geobacter sp.]|nr:D-glycero-beta-D-manno-heptose 1,7-bisphosphate 7-phosphatase [Geobacter sp.]
MTGAEPTGKRAVFLDRDGTINVEREYLHRPEDFHFVSGAPEAIRLFREAGFLVVVVTNQSGIGRGYYDEAAVEELHRHMDTELAVAGAAVDAYYYCPHHPTAGNGIYLMECTCRKPLPGMLHQAAADLKIDLSLSWMIGDKLVDVEAGQRAGCRTALVLTGYGAREQEALPPGVAIYNDILSAARGITAQD